jgi:hypothetical protein
MLDGLDAQHPGDDVVELVVVEDLLPVVRDDGLAAVGHRDVAGLGVRVRSP